MADWDPQLYRRFEGERTRPARELLARVALASPSVAFDLGCGPGNSTELLARRWPTARIVGTDNSQAMLATAQKRLPAVRFEPSDIASWQPEEAPDLIFANAALQWVGEHRSLLPRLFAALAPCGVLAVQIPDNLDMPSHRGMREVAALPQFAAAIGDAETVRSRILPAETYYDLVSHDAASVDVWRTTYYHPMPSPGAIVDWLRGTGLRPFLQRLDEVASTAFLREYEARIDAAFAERVGGLRLLPFPRLFIVATRTG